jgi:hypothetical protein
MLYQLPNGKTQKMTLEQYLAMSDEDLHQLEGNNGGFEINDPFYESALDEPNYIPIVLEEFELPEDVEELPSSYEEEDD